MIILVLAYDGDGLLEDSLQHNPLDKAVPLFFLKGGVWSFVPLQNYREGKCAEVKVGEGDLIMDTASHKLTSALHSLDPPELCNEMK
jgi:hypothetical protein